MVIWRDTTIEKKEKAVALQEELAREEEKLANCLQAQKLTKALRLALKLQKPMHVLRIIEGKNNFILYKRNMNIKLINVFNQL